MSGIRTDRVGKKIPRPRTCGPIPIQRRTRCELRRQGNGVNKRPRLLLLLLLFLTFSALVANPKKTTLHGGQSRSWSAEQGKKEKEKVWQRTPPPPPPPPSALLVRRKKKKKKSRGASTCLGATQAGVTQVVSVRLASVQGFLRLVS